MVLSVQEIYSVRFGTKLPLPKKFQDIIAQLRISPAAYRPVRSTQRNPRFIKPKNVVEEPQNWRESKLIDFVSKFKNTDDPDYGEIMSKFNKITTKTLEKLSNDIIEIIQKRDEDFRLRINALLFDRAITQDAYSTLMSDLAKKIYEKIPETVEDLKFQISLFHKLYNTEETISFPEKDDPEFDNKVNLWMKQKDKRKGFAKFLTNLYIREMVSEEIILDSLKNVIEDINEVARKPKSENTEETVKQYAVFLFETAKLLPKKSNTLRGIISVSVQTLLTENKSEVPSLNKQSQFKLEDTVKCVQ